MYNEITPQTQPKKKSAFLITILVIISAFILLSLGFIVGVWQTVSSTDEISFEEFIDTVPSVISDDQVDFGTFRQVWNAIQTRYVHGSQSEEEMYYGSLTGLVASLNDPYSVFFDPATTEEFNSELEGTFEGIGAEIGFKDDQLVVVAPLPDSPAAEAGLQSNDKIMMIDDLDSAGMSLSEAVSLIRGEKGTVVELGIIREEGNELFTVSIIRDTISLESVQWELLENDIAYLRIIHFDSKSTSEFDRAVREILIENPQGMILDLRDNPGGFLDAAVHITGAFLPDRGQVVVIEKFRNDQNKLYRSDKSGSITEIPVVVLVNGGSASASEIVAGALQDYDRATVIGEQTFGKGTVQDLEEYRDGSSLKLTIAEWFTPDERSIEDEGVEPDILVEYTEEDYLNDLDPQLDQAKEFFTTL